MLKAFNHGPLIDMILSIYLHWTRPQYKFYFGNFFHGPTSWCSKPDPRFVMFILGSYLCFFLMFLLYNFLFSFYSKKIFFVYKELISEGKFRVHRVGKLYSCVDKQWALWCMNMRYCSVISCTNNSTCQDKIFFFVPEKRPKSSMGEIYKPTFLLESEKMECDMLRPFFSWWP